MSERVQIAVKPAAAPARTLTPAPFGVLQRKCACGGSGAAGGECEECKKEKMALQRRAAGHTEPETVPPLVHDVLRSSGQPLDAATRAFFEPRFGHDFSRIRVHTSALPAHQTGLTIGGPHEPSEAEAERMARSIPSSAQAERHGALRCDFSQVRIHADARAAASAQAVNALAYTVGRDVVFGPGQYAPHTTEGRSLLAHELTHVVQQARGVASGPTPGGPAVQRKVVLKGVEMPAKDRSAFLKAHKWTNAGQASAVMEDMAAAGDAFDFANENELKTEIDKRLSTVHHMEESQQTVEKIPGDKRAAFGYPFTGASMLYGPRVNYSASDYWEPGVPDKYAVRKDKAKNKELLAKPRHERCTVYGDQCSDYGWKLSAKGKADPYHAIAYLFVPQPAHKRTLIHCDYLISLVNLMSFADSVGAAEFNKRVAAFGADKFFLKWNAFNDLHSITFERTATGEWAKSGGSAVPKKGLGSTQRVRPSSEADLVIGDHVVFFNHLVYDLINAKIGNAWRLENAVLIGKTHGKDLFLGHGSGYKTADMMREKLAEEFNVVARQALTLIAMTNSTNKKAVDEGHKGLFAKFPNVHPAGTEWHAQGVPGLLNTCPHPLDVKLKEIKPAEVLGPKSPCDPTKMNEVERPIESAK